LSAVDTYQRKIRGTQAQDWGGGGICYELEGAAVCREKGVFPENRWGEVETGGGKLGRGDFEGGAAARTCRTLCREARKKKKKETKNRVRLVYLMIRWESTRKIL